MELRRFPHVTHAFNLTAEELEARIVGPWVRGVPVEWGERRWMPEQAKLTIYEGAELRPEDIGMGRGWSNARRGAENVTERVLAAAESIEPFKEAVRAALPISLPAVLALAHERFAERRASERLEIAENAVWELLHEGRVKLVPEVPREEWRAVLLSWSSWIGSPDVILGKPPTVQD